MIPAIVAAPLVGQVLGSVVGQVASLFSGPHPATTAPSSFTPLLDKAAPAATQPAADSGVSGSMRAGDWNQMGQVDLQSWAKSLAGKHVDATDASGRTITGMVNGVQQLGNTLALNIGGHLVSLSQLKQVTWSPSVA